ncbi:hypothetical protein BC941DRAFT_89355 [Chlamydoabsidia padenii]|nr:hypothetical protein BC941DRAFT_89355 [Chlamydoabsidia padenii]
MPPHIQSPVDSEHDDDHIKLSDHFWSCDLKGMNQLMDHIINTYDELNQLHNIYVKRAELEHAFGQQLETLAEDSSTQENDKGVTGAIHVVQQELVKAAQSHLDFSKRLQQNVAVEMKRWVEDHQDELKKVKVTKIDGTFILTCTLSL